MKIENWELKINYKTMSQNKENNNDIGPELRQDLVSGDWVIMAPKRSHSITTQKKKKSRLCPFCRLEETNQEKPVLEYKREDGTWSLVVIPNKFPSLEDYNKLEKREVGPYAVMNAVGFHEVIITHDHDRHIPDLSVEEVAEIIDAYQDRYLDLMNKRFIDYISIFHNYGKDAGASLEHPHCQLMALTVVDPDIHRSLRGSKDYYQKHKQCVHCTMIEWEEKENIRIIYKNDDFIAIAPFVSRVPAEVRIYPRDHKAYFERITEDEKFSLAETLKEVISRIDIAFDDVAYNYFIHTAPCDGNTYDHYHWHLEIFPKMNIAAGFEKGAQMEIIPILPEVAAEKLREATSD